MTLVVKKFGGTSVGDVARIKNVALLVEAYCKEHPEDDVVVVVSAMAGETNKLIALAKSCVATPAPRELDVLMATGEQVTIALLSMALCERGIKAKSLLAQQARISTNTHYTNAQILDIDTTRVLESISEDEIPVVAGFQGIDDQGDVTTLGRGGSDITAVALAAALKAKACYIYTDVPGVFSTDPRICSEAKLLKTVCHEEMLEMASLGAKVLHPRSVYFAMQYQVPLMVLSTFDPGSPPGSKGTWIVKEEELMEKPVVTGITHRTDEAKITIHKLPGVSKNLNHIFETLAQKGIFVDMITQTGLIGGKTNISFTVPDESSSHAFEIIQSLVPTLGAEGADVDRNIAKVSVVGVGMRYHTGVAARMFGAFAQEEVDIQMISTSEIKISVVIPRKYCEIAVRTLHDAFIDFAPAVTKEESTHPGELAA